MMAVYFGLLILGFVGLIKGSDIFVEGSSALARRFGVPEIIIGLTIVAMGTSAPELAVSVTSAAKGLNALAISNVTGSNLFNLLMVLGVCSVIGRLPVDVSIIKQDYPLSILATAGLIILCRPDEKTLLHLDDIQVEVGALGRLSGIVLLLVFATYMAYLLSSSLKNIEKNAREESEQLLIIMLKIMIGIALVVCGGQLVVNNAKAIATLFGMSENLIGLTIVAVGTSLPELVTSVVAVKKGHADLAVGNVVGSNLFNILLILGVSAAIHPIAVDLASFMDICFLLFASAMCYAFVIVSKSINRIEGIIMIITYWAYMAYAACR